MADESTNKSRLTQLMEGVNLAGKTLLSLSINSGAIIAFGTQSHNLDKLITGGKFYDSSEGAAYCAYAMGIDGIFDTFDMDIMKRFIYTSISSAVIFSGMEIIQPSRNISESIHRGAGLAVGTVYSTLAYNKVNSLANKLKEKIWPIKQQT